MTTTDVTDKYLYAAEITEGDTLLSEAGTPMLVTRALPFTNSHTHEKRVRLYVTGEEGRRSMFNVPADRLLERSA